MAHTVLPLSDLYREAIRVGLRQQVPCAILCLLMLDGGRMARVCGVTMLGFWAGTALIMARRPLAPDGRDHLFIRWGFLPLLIMAAIWANLS
jgi:hypothetical protein